MNSLKEQRIAVKFCVKLGNSAPESFAMLNMAYGDVVMKHTACFKCVLNVLQHQLTTHTLTKSTLVRANRRLTIRELAEEYKISVGSCYEILTAKLKMHRVPEKFVPRNDE